MSHSSLPGIPLPDARLSDAEWRLATDLTGDRSREDWQVLRASGAEPFSCMLTGKIRLLLFAPEDTMATVALRITGAADIEIQAGVLPGASLTVLTIQEGAGEVRIVQRARVADGGRITWQNATFGAVVEQDLQSDLVGPHATGTVDWLFYARGNERQRLSAHNTFLAAAGGGEMTLQGVAEGHAHVRCSGLIAIGPGGGGTQTYLTESVLMLDPTAKVDAIPGLEIKTNDVKASHSATASRVTEEDLFTFAARGIPVDEARRMYIRGFLGAIAERIVDAGLREGVFRAIDARMGRLEP